MEYHDRVMRLAYGSLDHDLDVAGIDYGRSFGFALGSRHFGYG
jgi:hypothetical protein